MSIPPGGQRRQEEQAGPARRPPADARSADAEPTGRAVRPPRRRVVRTTVLDMHGNEERVVTAYAGWLQRNGWTVTREAGFADVYAERGPETLYAEAKGRTTSAGLDADTLYGQLLRRMQDPATAARHAVVIPTAALQAALRVPPWVRERLHIDIYEVDDTGPVHPRG